MLLVTKGYLLRKTPHNDFDEIIDLINEYGIKFTCISLGSRKIISKNNYHLNVGNFLEFEIFHSENKLSKLKKVTTLSYLEESKKANYALFVINEAFAQIDLNHKRWFNLYQDVILSMMQDINDYITILYLLVKIYELSGLNICFNNCFYCGSTKFIKTVDFNKYQVVCKLCLDPQKHKVFKKSNMITFQKMHSSDQGKLVDHRIEDIDDLRELIKTVMTFIYDNLGIFFESLKTI
ncbi:MAG: DNA repair protein RecO [Mycoplasma sp.]